MKCTLTASSTSFSSYLVLRLNFGPPRFADTSMQQTKLYLV